jgi:hypothetical protein
MVSARRLASAAWVAVVVAVVGVPGAGAQTALVGYDLSYPQCNTAFPAGGAFVIVGVNAGLPFSANPCLGVGDGASELQWAGTGAELYANTADPGPMLSSHWPNGQAAPRQCNTTVSPGADTSSCAYDYGWNAAADSYQDAVNAYVAVGLAPAGSTRTPSANVWWLDVESANSWEANSANNVAELQGEVDSLKALGIASVGVYAPAADWQAITGGTTAFASLPFWLPGVSSLADAESRCSQVGADGGATALVQFPQAGSSVDVSCAEVPVLAFATGPQTVAAGDPTGPLSVQLPTAPMEPISVLVTSSSATGSFATSATGPWTATLATLVAAGAITTGSFYYRDRTPGSPVVRATADGYAAATQTETVTAAVCSLPTPHDRGLEIALAHTRTRAAAALLQREMPVRVADRRLHVTIEEDGCNDFELEISGLPSRAAALALLRRLRPRFRGAALEPR